VLSWAAMNRIVEQTAESDAEYRKGLGDRPLRSQARRMTDRELLARLASFGIEIDRPSLARLCSDALSAEEVARPLIEQRTFATCDEELQGDWIWICLAALWQRWFPDLPSFETLDDAIQAGYGVRQSAGAPAACRVWLEAWTQVLRLADRGGARSIREFDERFRGTQSLFNWIQDLQDELWNAGLHERRFLVARAGVCEEALNRFRDVNDPNISNRRVALAESCFELGEIAKAERLFREWLQADPCWGWGWIGWSDCYGATRTEARDVRKAEERLREALAIGDLRDRRDVLERLATVCDDQGRADEAKALRREAKAAAARERELRAPSRLRTVIGSPEPATAATVGRNEPCPCGSGKKFKKCCGG